MPPKPPAAWQATDRFQTLVDSIDEGFCVIQVIFDETGKAVDYVFLEANGVFELQTGLRDAIGRSMKSLAPEHEEHWFRTYGEVARSGESVRFEAPAEALRRWYDVYAFRVGEPGDCMVGVLFKDIIERKKLERSIEQQNQTLREADRRKDRFIAVLSHELRNPLAPLKVAADLLGSEGLGEKQLIRTRDIIRRQVSHMARLLDDLLDISRITQGKLALRREWVPPRELIDSAVEGVRPLAERKQHALDIQLQPDMPLIEVDPIRMSQVVANLLTNAAKYTDVAGRITLSARVESDSFVVEVRDTGIGIEREDLREIFEMFSQQPEATGRSEGGLGIGLALVRGLVGLHGGSVQAESEGKGKGSHFTVRVPVSPGAAPREALQGAAEAHHSRRRILIADDNRDAAESMAMLLDHLGHEVRIAFDGQSALTVARTFQPDLAFLDIGMPKMNGYDVARALRKEAWSASLVLVAATGWGDVEARRMAMDSGFDHHLTKPIEPDALKRMLGIRERTRRG